ncbi:hypothetical protein CSAL01_06343 [Colletotrichum salicis]|uniref:Uncharacterized protein n=1 Tax=Colletotrichum salicis TaxID=1209931 RepID=A0A135TAP1_9PEZI|nr:hypothetical protein CSAL01_06343 [Colletotrichum salicis]
MVAPTVRHRSLTPKRVLIRQRFVPPSHPSSPFTFFSFTPPYESQAWAPNSRPLTAREADLDLHIHHGHQVLFLMRWHLSLTSQRRSRSARALFTMFTSRQPHGIIIQERALE